MPPRAKFTKEHIAKVAFDLVRADGMEALTARNLGKHLGSSYCPIFTLFSNMEEVQNAVMKQANDLYDKYINEGLNQEIAFIGTGTQFVKFAKNEPKLFKIMFLQGNAPVEPANYLPDTRTTYPKVLASLTGPYNLSEEAAKHIYLHLAVYTVGIGTLCAGDVCAFNDEQVKDMFTEVFHSLLTEIK